MDDELKKWFKQYNANTGAREFLRLGCVMIIWGFTLMALSVAFELAGHSTNLIFSSILVISIFAFPFIAFSWKPAYSFLRRILGNDNLPLEPMPRSTTKIPRQPRPWWSYLPSLWFTLMSLLLLYFVIKYISK